LGFLALKHGLRYMVISSVSSRRIRDRMTELLCYSVRFYVTHGFTFVLNY